MKCQNCGENEANVKYTQIINGVKKQMSLCDKCAKELGIEDINFNMPINFSSFLSDMFDMYEEKMPLSLKTNTLICDKCNTTYDDFVNTGRFGCDNCYSTFERQLDLLLKNIQGANKHVGRIGKYIGNNIEKKEQKVNVIGNKDEEKDENKVKEKVKKEEKIKEETNKSKIAELEERLRIEIQEERYEDAAKTRDEIKKLK